MSTMTILALLLTIPSGIVVALILTSSGVIPKGGLHTSVAALVSAVVMSMLVLACGYGSIALQTSDVEILSGQVTGKSRVHGHYEKRHESCTTTNGKQTCRVWYEDRYTVTWDIATTLGSINVDSLDSSSQRVYKEPDPQAYAAAYVGEPAAKESRYRNYLKGIPKEFLYNDHMASTPEALAKVPSYPHVHSLYKISRVIDLDGVSIPAQTAHFNKMIAERLKTLGASKEVNIIVLLGNWDDTFQYAIRERWDGGKKNDVIVYMGIEDGKIQEARVQTWGKNELFSLRLQDALIELKTLDDSAMTTIFEHILAHYERPRMRDFEYLSVHIRPSNTSITFMFLLVLLGPVGAWAFTKYQPRSRYR